MKPASSLKAAVPAYVGSDFSEAPPGHKYKLYFQFWDTNWNPAKETKLEILQQVAELPKSARDQLNAVVTRQKTLAEKVGAKTLTGIATSPFTTGLGIEHPIENGFAFLDPYGVPYLPGSSIKGVVRRAAEELALFEKDSNGWSIVAVWWLFGFDAASSYLRPVGKDEASFVRKEVERWHQAFKERTSCDDPLFLPFFEVIKSQIPPEEKITLDTFARKLQESEVLRKAIHVKGLLDFWDSIPVLPNGELRVDIMNPHYTHYYQEGKPPGDWGSPNPIFFLTLPVGTEFTFHVRLLRTSRVPPSLLENNADGIPRWWSLLDAAFKFAFEWIGFGAKTAVGYGRLEKSLPTSTRKESATETKQRGFVETDLPQPRQKPQVEASSVLASLEEKIRNLNPKDAASLNQIENALCRSYKDPLAPSLAMLFWEKINKIEYIARKIKKNPILWELIQKGGRT